MTLVLLACVLVVLALYVVCERRPRLYDLRGMFVFVHRADGTLACGVVKSNTATTVTFEQPHA